jgi:hypothetical protein
MKLEGGERLVLKTLLGLQGDSTDNVADSQIAGAASMHLCLASVESGRSRCLG